MNKKLPGLEDPHETPIIKVIGVGGGGGNAVGHMYKQGIRGVEFYICNTDIQALDMSPVPNKIQIGRNLTAGLGAGANPERGHNAALENKEELREILSHNTKMLFITAGMGGGTGTGAAPVIAEVARELDILTVGIVTAPFSFEGKPKRVRAKEGIDELRAYCDTVLVILNDRLRDVYGKASMREAFRQADNVLTKAAKSIAEIITVSGTINVDFEDVRTVMKDAGAAVMGSATAEGENRARRAAEGAITSPLLNNTDIYGAKYILLSIVVGDEDTFQMEELEEITDYAQEQAGEEAEIIFGQAIDETLGDSISVTIIATGFEERDPDFPQTSERRVYDLSKPNKHVKNRVKVDERTFERKDFFDRPVSRPPATDQDDEQDQPPPRRSEPTRRERTVYNLEDDHYPAPDPEREEREKKKVNRITTGTPLATKPAPIKSVNEMSDQELQERKDTPAYLRRNIQLKETPGTPQVRTLRSRFGDED
ncbi:MAG: cell division protein FtsZ [Bernardetiaceae bacterium]